MCVLMVFFFNDTATTEIYTLSLHDALPIFGDMLTGIWSDVSAATDEGTFDDPKTHVSRQTMTLDEQGDRKSTRLNSSHANISYAVFCLKKKINCFRHPSPTSLLF